MIVEMKNMKKAFGQNIVLDDVSITVQAGQIVALLGENGAGKSTLMNILGGVHTADEGTIKLDGKEVRFATPAESQEAGIAFIHQELNLINDLPIYENMFLGRELKTKHGFLALEEMIKETEDMFRRMQVDLDPRMMVRDLDQSYKQIIEICRAMLSEAAVIIMDEPTTSLTDQEIERVFQMMDLLKAHEVGMIFISHKLKEVMEICDHYVVLRDGQLVAKGQVSDVTSVDLAHAMVGYDVRTERLTRNQAIGDEVLRLEGLTADRVFRDVHFSLNAGEIVGVTGLLGDGRSELFQAVFGAYPVTSGKVYINGKERTIKSTRQAMDEGIAYLPRNRKENAILKDMNILENASIPTWTRFSTYGVIHQKAHVKTFSSLRTSLRIKMNALTDRITSLSGGNQQKVMLAKWLATNPQLLILDNPTQGVDVGGKEDIYDIILKLAEEQMAIIVLSSEAQEIIRLCDRAVVMYQGTIQGEVSREEMNEQNMMHLATGGAFHIQKEEETDA
ncbi:sugar ABC transporter ATP-binding protein [Bacillaceae bacterium SIJ1]|nr:sugar ABC transporter ATP-binding protein [Litoribacterium kuwaitense]